MPVETSSRRKSGLSGCPYDTVLRANGVPFRHVTSFDEALQAVPPGRLEVIANYTAFQDIRAELDRVN